MSINTTQPSTDITDKDARKLGGVSITDNYQDRYLPLILLELRRISILLASMSDQNVDFDDDADFGSV